MPKKWNSPEEKAAYSRAYYLANRERLLTDKAEHYARNRERLNAERKLDHATHREARLATQAKWRERNRERERERAKAYYHNNKERAQATARAWRERNKEYLAAYRDKNRDRIRLAWARWNAANPGHKAKWERERRAANPQFALAKKLRCRLNAALKGRVKGGSAVRLLGCTIDELKSHLEGQFREGMSWENFRYHGWHVDHIMPLCSFDLTDVEQLSKACHYTNLQPLWAAENRSKNGKIPNRPLSAHG